MAGLGARGSGRRLSSKRCAADGRMRRTPRAIAEVLSLARPALRSRYVLDALRIHPGKRRERIDRSFLQGSYSQPPCTLFDLKIELMPGCELVRRHPVARCQTPDPASEYLGLEWARCHRQRTTFSDRSWRTVACRTGRSIRRDRRQGCYSSLTFIVGDRALPTPD